MSLLINLEYTKALSLPLNCQCSSDTYAKQQAKAEILGHIESSDGDKCVKTVLFYRFYRRYALKRSQGGTNKEKEILFLVANVPLYAHSDLLLYQKACTMKILIY